MKINNKKISLVSLAVFSVIIFSLALTHNRVEAQSGSCFFKDNGQDCSTNIDYGTNDVFTGRDTSGNGSAINTNTVNSTQTLAQYVKNRYNSSNAQDKTGAAFVISEVLNISPTRTISDTQMQKFIDTMTQKGLIFNHIGSGWVGSTSFYNPNKNDVFYSYQGAMRELITITCDSDASKCPDPTKAGQVLMIIEVRCGNLLSGTALPQLKTAAITTDALVWNSTTPNNKQQEIAAAPGSTVYFYNSVQVEASNTGNDQFGFDIIGTNFTTNMNYSASVPYSPSGEKVPNDTGNEKRIVGYVIPTNTPIGTQICRETSLRQASIANDPYATSDQPPTKKACVTVDVTTITPSTSVDPPVIAFGQTATFTHGATTSAYKDPGKQYKWTVYEWTNINPSPYTKASGTTTSTADGWVRLNQNPYTANNPNVTQVCQSLKLEKVNSNDGSFQLASDSQYCVLVAGTTDRNITMQARGGSDVYVQPEEPGDGAGVWASVDSGSTPKLDTKPSEWGYNQKATPAKASKVQWKEYPQDASKVEGPSSATKSEPAQYDNTYKVYYCTDYYKTVSGTNCVWSVTVYKYKCPNGSTTDWLESAPPCDSWYESTPCKDGSAGKYAKLGGLDCDNTWLCAPQAETFVGRGEPVCEYRCEGGQGAVAPLSTASKEKGFDVHAGTDLNCYKRWSFQVRCTYSYSGTWRYKPSTNSTATITVTVYPDSDLSSLCPRDPKYYGGNVSDVACFVITALPIVQPNGQYFVDNGGDTLYPGRINNATPVRWGVVSTPNQAQQCFNTIAKPYIDFDKTDIRALTTGVSNPLGGNGIINTVGVWSSNYYGSTVGYAAFANGSISGLKTYTPYGNSTQNRAFSNSGYSQPTNLGGNFGGAATKSYTDLRDDMTNGPYESNCNINNLTYSKVTVIYCSDTATVSANKATEWTINNPNSVYIIASTINIVGSVTNLNGVALIARNINTCSDGYAGCGNQLKITGSVMAEKIYFKRAANVSYGSSVYCIRPTRAADLAAIPSGSDGRALPHTCDAYANPGEVVNYSPEFNLSSPPYQPTTGVRTGTYDSIRSLPPIY